MFPRHTPYAVARFDGVLIFNSIQAGEMATGLTRSPIVRIHVLAGIQRHPVWALDRLALTIYSYCQVAKAMELAETQLQVSVTASWVSSDLFSNLIATHVEWHTASDVRTLVHRMMADVENGKKHIWPMTEMSLPVQTGAQA